MPHPHLTHVTAQDVPGTKKRLARFRAPSAPTCSVNDDRAALKNQVKEANDIVAVVGKRINLRPAGPTFKGLCPFHEDSRPSLDVDPRRQRYRCWACGKHGDVFNFVQEYDKVSFPEALELLARDAGISLEKVQKNPTGPSRAGMLDVMKWAGDLFQRCLLDSPDAEAARKYLGERKLAGDTVRKFGLGYAPAGWEWLVREAGNAGKPAGLLEAVGLIAKRDEGKGYYDRFRDRVMFPIRDILGRIVGFGGRILPSSAVSADRPPPKYYNSAETSLFSKSDQLYGIDLARQAGNKAGYLAIVEGYTDVMMAHQHGVCQVVATMGTALNARHLRKLKDVASRVVLVYDADAGGEGGVDRALEVFVAHDLDLRIATLPEGLDPCDLLVAQGPEPFRKALESAVDVFEVVLDREWKKQDVTSVEGRRLAAEGVLRIVALSPQERSVKMELMVNRIAHRLQVKEETLWLRLKELRGARRSAEAREAPRSIAAEGGSSPEGSGVRAAPATEERAAKAAPHERELVEVLLAEPALVARAVVELPSSEVEHPGLRKVIEALYRLHALGQPADLDRLQGMIDNERLWAKILEFHERGLDLPDRPWVFQKVLERFGQRRKALRKQALLNQLESAADESAKLAILAQLRDLK